MKFAEYKELHLTQVAQTTLSYWKEQGIFEKSIAIRKGNPSFVFYEGPPSANGLPGIHHVMSRTIKDLFCRYKTQKGYCVQRKAGWDTHGLPIELSVEKELGITKEDIGVKITVSEYNQACKRAVMRYTDVWNDLTEKIGYWVNMEHPYITYQPKYMESVWWLLKEIYNKRLLYKGYTIQPYSPKAGTGLSSHELNQPGCYRDVTDTTVVAQFKISAIQTLPKGKDFLQTLSPGKNWGDVYFLAWTTTPWTLPSNTALTVGPKISYTLIRTFNQYTFEPMRVILAENLVEKLFSGKYVSSGNEEDFDNFTKEAKKIPYTILSTFKGSDLVGIRYEQLLSYAIPYQNPENAFRVIAGDFVTTDEGTGIVHTAPTFGADDARAAKEATPEVPPMLVLDENGNPVPLVDLQGRFRSELPEIGGKYVKNEYYEEGNAPEKSVDVEIAIKLKEENKAFKVEKYTHSYPHCWRTDKPVLYYPLDSWFIKITEVRARMYELNKTINWKPKATGEGRFGNWLQNANDWNLSRSRFWGIPLPVWRTEDGKEEIIIGSVDELKAEMEKAVAAGFMEKDIFPDFVVNDMSEENYRTIDLHKDVVDAIVLVSPSGKPMKRESDLIDVWFDSGAMPYAQWHYPFEVPAPSNLSREGKSIPGYHTARKSSYSLLKKLKEEKKKQSTEAEKILWNALRGKKLEDYKFRREHIIDEFKVDFVCLSKKLIVEVDGGYHNKPEIQEADRLRTKLLEEDLGYKVIRFTNEEVIGDLESVLHKIKAELSLPLQRGGNGRGLEGFFPADFIAEGVDQTRGWFYTLHAIATLVFDSVAYKNVVSNGLVLDKNGQKMSKRLGNVVNPFEMLNLYGPDATRWYLMSNSDPWDNLKFDAEGIAEVRRKFFGTLYNTYSFFSLYANIDGFRYAEAELPLEERPELDRWILSELHTLIQKTDEAYSDYEPTKAARAIATFVQDHLSNWYVRLSRRRFWKGDYGADKVSAYQTLYTCLVTVAKLSAPIAPFYADALYRDLTSVTGKDMVESVHLADFPEYVENFVDKKLERKMEKAQLISSLALSLRKKEMIKVRQPLQKILIPALDAREKTEILAVSDLIKSEVNVKEIVLLDDASDLVVKRAKPNYKVLGPRFGKEMKGVSDAIVQLNRHDIARLERERVFSLEVNGAIFSLGIDEVEISSQDIEGWVVASSEGVTVALDTTITPELRREGIARELVNRIQNLRKELGMEVTDKITITLQKNNLLEDAALQNEGYIKNETLAIAITFEDRVEEGVELAFDGVYTKALIKKHY